MDVPFLRTILRYRSPGDIEGVVRGDDSCVGATAAGTKWIGFLVVPIPKILCSFQELELSLSDMLMFTLKCRKSNISVA